MRWEPQTHLPLLEPYLIQDHLAKLALMQRASGAEMPLFQSTLKVTVSDFQGRGLTTTLLVPFPFAGNKHCLAGRLDCVINIIGHMLQYLSTKKRLLYCMKWHNYFMYRLYTICESWTPLSNVFIRRTTWLCAKESMSAHVQQSVVYIYILGAIWGNNNGQYYPSMIPIQTRFERHRNITAQVHTSDTSASIFRS